MKRSSADLTTCPASRHANKSTTDGCGRSAGEKRRVRSAAAKGPDDDGGGVIRPSFFLFVRLEKDPNDVFFCWLVFLFAPSPDDDEVSGRASPVTHPGLFHDCESGPSVTFPWQREEESRLFIYLFFGVLFPPRSPFTTRPRFRSFPARSRTLL